MAMIACCAVKIAAIDWLCGLEAELPQLLRSSAAWAKQLVTAAWVLTNHWSRRRPTEHTH